MTAPSESVASVLPLPSYCDGMYSDLSSNDVAEIHATLKNMGVDPSALYKGSSTPIHVADVKEDGKWVTLKVKVVHIWDNTSDKIT